MKDTITKFQFVEEMAQDKHGFSYEGASALFDYFEQYENDCATEIEFDTASQKTGLMRLTYLIHYNTIENAVQTGV